MGTSIDQNHELGVIIEGIPIDKGRYQWLVGRLIDLFHTRPNIAYAVSMVSQFMHPILRYLKLTPGKGLLFSKNNQLRVEAYKKLDWVDSITDRRSISRYCTFMGGNLVTWRSKKQVVAWSSAEAEFWAMTLGICKLMWLKGLLRELQVNLENSMRLYCDNKAVISITHNLVQHDKIKHVEIDRYFIKEKIDSGLICTPFVGSKLQLVDVFTKGV